MAEVLPYYTFLRNHSTLSQEKFMERWEGVPFLYFQNLPDLQLTDVFTTMRITPGVTPPDLGLQGIIPIRKEEKSNAFGMMITMGRAKNNDLVVPDKRVSKFHCYFRKLGDTWKITDANSTNGTKVNATRVPPERSLDLKSGAVIELSGTIKVTYLEADELYEQIQEAKAWVV